MLRVFLEKFSQAWSACLLCMVQGDLTVLTMAHAFTASKTGFLTGVAYILTSAGNQSVKGRWYPVWVTGVLTMLADLIVHPTHFGPHWMEAFCTGLGSAGLCFIWERSNGTHRT